MTVTAVKAPPVPPPPDVRETRSASTPPAELPARSSAARRPSTAPHTTTNQGLTLVHYSAQLEPFLTQKHTLNTPNTPYHCLNDPENNP